MITQWYKLEWFSKGNVKFLKKEHKRIDSCTTESLCCTPDTNIPFIVNQLYSNIQKKKSLKKVKNSAVQNFLSKRKWVARNVYVCTYFHEKGN